MGKRRFFGELKLQKYCKANVVGYVHAKPDNFENATFFIRIGLPYTAAFSVHGGVFGVQKRNFLKTLSKVDKFENAG